MKKKNELLEVLKKIDDDRKEAVVGIESAVKKSDLLDGMFFAGVVSALTNLKHFILTKDAKCMNETCQYYDVCDGDYEDGEDCKIQEELEE